MRTLGLVIVSFLLVLALTGSALAWGDAPTHFSIGNDVATSGALPPDVDVTLYIRACACADIANTQLFKAAGLGYVHSLDFAESLLNVARSYPAQPDWLAAAYAWGTHLAADQVAHEEVFPEEGLIHSLAEVAADTCVFYGGSPLGGGELPDWGQFNVGPDCCNPWLIYLASRDYRSSGHPGARLVYPWAVRMALQSLATSIGAEYEYIEAKGVGGAYLSESFLENLLRRGILRGDWEAGYVDSVQAAQTWVEEHQ